MLCSVFLFFFSHPPIVQENDQLNQDKCELTAMIAQLKEELGEMQEKNKTLNFTLDNLKRWVAKRAEELHLDKYQNKEWEDRPGASKSSSPIKRSQSPLLLGDPSLHSSAVTERTTSPLSALSLPEVTTPTKKIFFTPKPAQSPRQILSSPWVVEHSPVQEGSAAQAVVDKKEFMVDKKEFIIDKKEFIAEEPQVFEGNGVEMMQSSSDQVFYLDNGYILIMGNAQTTMPQSPSRASSLGQEQRGIMTNSLTILNRDANDILPVSAAKTSEATKESAIEGLLRLHCPNASLGKKPSAAITEIPMTTAVKATDDHNYIPSRVPFLAKPESRFTTASSNATNTITTTNDIASLFAHVSQEQLLKALKDAGVAVKVPSQEYVTITVPVSGGHTFGTDNDLQHLKTMNNC